MNKNIKLPKRLAAAARLVREGSACADVGCDHGKLAAYLVLSNRCSGVTASDINERPLEKARELFARLGIADRVRTELCGGLDKIAPHEAEDIVIAGLGCDTILSIIDAAPWVACERKRLVLVPASHHALVRRGLYERGFRLLEERAVFERGHCYTVMSAQWCGSPKQIDELFAAVGLMEPGSPDADRYIENERRKAELIALSGAQEEKRESALGLCRDIERYCHDKRKAT